MKKFLPYVFCIVTLCLVALELPLARGAKSSAQKKFETFAQKHVRYAAMHVMPSKKHKAVRQEGGIYVASYVEIDPENIQTELRLAKSGRGHVGVIKYQEFVYECSGATEQEALKAQCFVVRTRRLTEILAYD